MTCRLLLPFATLCLLLSYTPAGTPAIAQDEAPPKPDRPFVDNMTREDAEADILKVINKDDEAAYKRINDGRLQWVSLLLGSRFRKQCVYWAHDLLLQEIEWVRRVQRWEVALAASDPENIVKSYTDLKGEFRDDSPQLCRALVALRNIGAHSRAEKLAATAPKDPWVKAADAWLGRLETAEACANALTLVMPAFLDQAEQFAFAIEPGLLDEQASEYELHSGNYDKLTAALSLKPEGVWALGVYPKAWNSGHFFERLGVLVSQDGRPEFRDRIAKQFDVIAANRPGALGGRISFDAGAGTPPERVLGPSAQESIGPRMLAYARGLPRDHDYPQLVCAISAFQGQPDWPAAQAYLLDRVEAYGDVQCAVLAARMVLAQRDDRRDAIISVAAWLRSSKLHKKRADAFRKALESCGEVLKPVSQAMAGKGEFPSDFLFKRLGLTVDQRAALVNALAEDEERKAYGNQLGVYWMNLAMGRWSQLDVLGGLDAALSAIEADCEKTGWTNGTQSVTQTYLQLVSIYPADNVPTLLKSVSNAHPKAVVLVQAAFDVMNTLNKEELAKPEWAGLATQLAIGGQQDLSEEQSRLLAENPHAGGGWGRIMLGKLSSSAGSTTRRNELFAMADAACPTDHTALFERMDADADFGRYGYGNWLALERLTVRAALLSPFQLDVIGKLASVHVRMGKSARGVGGLVVLALGRTMTPYYRGRFLYSLGHMLFSRDSVAALVVLTTNVYGEQIFDGWEPAATNVIQFTRHGRSVEWNMGEIAAVTPPGVYIETCVERELRSGQEDVNHLLNMAHAIVGAAPKRALELVAKAEELGVSEYGYFVASQMFIRGKAALGEWDAAIARYREMRDEDVGNPANLDNFLLQGMAQANDWAHIEEALKEVRARKPDLTDGRITVAMRRAYMAAGLYKEADKTTLSKAAADKTVAFHFGPWSDMFYAARAKLDAGKFVELTNTSNAYYARQLEQTPGMALDAALIYAICCKVGPALEPPNIDENGYLHVLDADVADYFPLANGLLDQQAMRILCGTDKPDTLPQEGPGWIWHGARYAERPSIDRGAGFITPGEIDARDHFVRGVIAWLTDDNAAAREQLQECIEKNQRFSHEYHVAEWLLDKQIPKK